MPNLVNSGNLLLHTLFFFFVKFVFMGKELSKAYEPGKYEEEVYQRWKQAGVFNPDKLDTGKDAEFYTITMPPPNRTGVLHMGHAAMLGIEDILIRYHRMKGERALWVPGTDHAAIATQTKVEKILKKEGIDRHALGREKFLERVQQFAQESHATIVKQVERMGCSCDWSREAYTLDKTRSKAVNSVFKLMYDDGLIYRGERIVNWCPRCHSTLADDEVEYKEQRAKLYTFKYSKDFPFAIATTRPETKLGDTAVAVNPKDKRYRKYIGKIYKVNFVGISLILKIIGAREVEKDFGTGALGVTPAHSIADWQLAEDNKLPVIKVINEDGQIHPGFGEYSNKSVLAARKMIVAKLRENGLLEKEEDITNNLSLCYRCDTPIEPLPSKQWFINVNKPLRVKKQKSKKAKKQELNIDGKTIKEIAIEVVKLGKIKIVPKRFEKNYFHWMENLRDWCISRQIWFGHQVPVWYRTSTENKVRLLLVRHGQTDWNKKGIMQGQKDIPLNHQGEQDALKLRKKIEQEKFDIIITSPLKRTSKTAELLNSYNVEIIEDERLKERSYGKFEGLKTNEILKKYPEIETFKVNGLPYWINVPTAETYDEVKARVSNFIEDIKKKYAGKRVLVVSHGDTLDMFYAILNNLPNEKAYGRFSLNMRLEKYELDSEEIYVGTDAPQEKGWQQDEDTLDTWFSSGLWTFSTLANSPEKIRIEDGRLVIDSEDFRNFHPTSVLETGYDILFFWVARMIIMTTYAVNDIPFKTVYLHGLVRDEKGKKMSKSVGNVIDPLDMGNKYGTDATRLSLVIGTTPGNDTNLSEEKIAGYRNFINKLWNISRFVLATVDRKYYSTSADTLPEIKTLSDKWIIDELIRTIITVDQFLVTYNFSQAGEELRNFLWDKLADWYLEIGKIEKNKDEILIFILRNTLKLLHPYTPFVTEKIWSLLNSDKQLIIESWPRNLEFTKQGVKFSELGVKDKFNLIKNIIIAIRNARAENKVEPGRKIKTVIYAGKHEELIKIQEVLIKSLRTGIEELEIKKQGKKIDEAIYLSVGDIDIYLLGAVDKEKEVKRVNKEIANLEAVIKRTKIKLTDKNFVKRAPERIVKAEQEKLAVWEEELRKLKDN